MTTPRTALEELAALVFNAQHTPNEFNQRAYEIAAGKVFWNHGKALSEALDSESRLRDLLESIQFANRGYCPCCSGWEVVKGQGENPGRHTKTCILAKELPPPTSAKGSETGHE